MLIDFASGLMYENEVLNHLKIDSLDVVETKFIRATVISNLMYTFKKDILLNIVTYYQPYILDIFDFRLLNDLSFSFFINDKISFLISSTLRFDSKPPSVLVPFDISNSVGLNFSL